MSNKNKKILIIEDDKFLAKMLSRMLESHNYETTMASNGREGLLKASGGDVGLILLDIMLPDIDGFDLLETIKSNENVKKIPIIIMSNLGQPEDISQGKTLGAKDYLVKSDLSLDEVIKKIRKYLPPAQL
ncbi:response regulator [Candidatus Falkowbacteria bacterium]|nr:response regulator [Candidatus Falkowbacteria bacterium]